MHSSSIAIASYVDIDFKLRLILYRLLAHILQCSTLSAAMVEIQMFVQLLLKVSALIARPPSVMVKRLYALERVQLN